MQPVSSSVAVRANGNRAFMLCLVVGATLFLRIRFVAWDGDGSWLFHEHFRFAAAGQFRLVFWQGFDYQFLQDIGE